MTDVFILFVEIYKNVSVAKLFWVIYIFMVCFFANMVLTVNSRTFISKCTWSLFDQSRKTIKHSNDPANQ
jgi:hypothetical protein